MKTHQNKYWRETAVLLLLLLSGTLGKASTFYWVGGTGLWSDPTHQHWVTSSGGTTTCNNQPGPSDDVYFDSNSFPATGSRVTVDVNHITCRNFDWTAVTNHPVFNLDTIGGPPGSAEFDINGSFILSPDMDWNYGEFTNPTTIKIGSLSSGHILDFGGLPAFGRTIIIIGDQSFQTGLIIQLSDIQCWRLEVNNGSLNTQGKNINASDGVLLFGSGQTVLSNSIITTKDFSASQSAVIYPGNSFIYSNDFDVWNSVTPYNYVSANQADIHNAHVLQLHIRNSLDGINSHVDKAFIGLDIVQNCQVHVSGFSFGKCICRGVNFNLQHSTFSTAINFDTLFLATPGGNYSFSGGDSIVINNEFIVNGGPGNLTNLNSSGGPGPTKIFGYTDTICLDYISLSNIQATGPAIFYAGANSIDLGGNIGWNFSACSNLSNVWPGDVDYDLSCNNLDVLSIGLAYGNSGPVRNGASTSWIAQPAPNWPGYFNSGVNFKHADTNGDGIVDINDTAAVFINYSQIHPARLSPVNSTSSLTSPRITLTPLTHVVGPGAHVSVLISCGTTSFPVDSIYGLAFTINLDPALIKVDSITTDFSGSWLGNTSSDLISFTKMSPSSGQFDVTLVRNDHFNVIGGNGFVGLFDVVIVDNVSTVQSQLLRVSNVHGIKSDETPVALNAGTDSILIDPSIGVNDITRDDLFTVYPNPSSGLVYIKSSMNILSVSLTNTMGTVIEYLSMSEGKISLNLAGLSPDVYILNIKTGIGIYRRKVVVRKQ